LRANYSTRGGGACFGKEKIRLSLFNGGRGTSIIDQKKAAERENAALEEEGSFSLTEEKRESTLDLISMGGKKVASL